MGGYSKKTVRKRAESSSKFLLIMPVLFRKYQNNNRQSKGFGKWYARTIQPSTIDTDGLAKIMQANCTVKAADIKAVLTELAETMRIQLQESKRVVLDGIGSFKLGMSCIGADKAENFNVANNVKEVYVNYTPESTKERIGIDTATGKAKSTFVKDFTRGVTVQEAPKNDVGTSTDDTTTTPTNP